MALPHPEIKKTFTRFVIVSMTVMTILVLLIAGGSVRLLLLESIRTEQNMRVQEAVASLQQYVQVRANQLADQRSIPLLTQAVLQPDNLLPSAEDLLNELYLQQQLYQQKLLDFSGTVLYERYPSEIKDYSVRDWFDLLSHSPEKTAAVLITGSNDVDADKGNQPYLELVVPLIYNGQTEGFLLTAIGWQKILRETQLKSALQGIALSLGEPGGQGHIRVNDAALVLSPDSSRHEKLGEWLTLNQSFLTLPVYFQLDESRIDSLIYRHLLILFAVFVVMAIVITLFVVSRGQRLFVMPLENLRQHIHLLENGDQQEISTPDNASKEMAGLIRQFNRMAANVLQREDQLKQTNRQLIENQQQLLQSEKMASVGTMAAGVAHEINNPVAFVLSNTHTLKEYIDEFSELVDTIKKQDWQQAAELCRQYDIPELISDSRDILSESQEGLIRVRDIVASLKKFAHADSEKTELVDLKSCIEFTLKLIWNEIKYVAELTTDLLDDIQVEANEGQLSQVFANLLINASHAIQEQGHISVAMRLNHSSVGSTSVDKPSVDILISDNGKGMDDKTLQRIFEPFYTDKEVGVGTGLGLSISQGIIQGLNGRIEVSSQPGQGSTFTVTLPLAA
ncbi:sensor histidine kinase [Bacterioplanoides sp.]|uniref:sensor histidine kinase n=1 Tax=Bacterioplanoides sp. TaxID=2066072 RepID=UPI003B000536